MNLDRELAGRVAWLALAVTMLPAVAAPVDAVVTGAPELRMAPLAPAPSEGLGVLEALPDRVRTSLGEHERVLQAAAREANRMLPDLPQYVIVEQARRWRPGELVRVAFRGGSEASRQRIEALARRWVAPAGGANLRLSFRTSAGGFRDWSPADVVHAAEIRIAFASGPVDGGHWSHLGRTSVNAWVEGGRPGQASMNLDGFGDAWPADGDAIVLHEFGHALGLEHEHQNPAGGCDFRFEDDPGYTLRLQDGVALPDAAGRRPGLYTALGHRPNQWIREKVDANLRALRDSRAYAIGPFDRQSIMKYRFDAAMFVSGPDSPCYTDRLSNRSLSPQDLEAARVAYPNDPAAMGLVLQRSGQVLSALAAPMSAPDAVARPARAALEALGGRR